jgi:hypothetical protein
MTDQPRYDWRRNFSFRDEVAHGYARAPLKPWANAAAASQLLVSLVAFALAAPGLRSRDEAGRETAAQGAVALLALALQIPLSTPLWEHLPELRTVQFPWRFAGLQGLAACALLSLAVARVRALPAGRRRSLATIVLAAGALPALAVSASALATAQFRFDAQLAARRAGNVIFEYLPRGVEDWKRFGHSPATEVPRIAIIEGEGRIHEVRWGAQQRGFTVDAHSDVRVRLRTFHWPGWRALVDARARALAPAGPQRALELTLPPGRHRVEIAFVATPLRRAAGWLSAGSWALAAVLGLVAWRRAHST